MKYDLIVVACSKNQELVNVTQRCIDSCIDDGADVNVILVETNGTRAPAYRGVNHVIMYMGDFVYNRALNMGLKVAKGDIHILANNDIVFESGWSQIGQLMKLNKYLSASALSEDIGQRHFKRGNWIYEGYSVGGHITGWCLFVAKECIKKIGSLREDFEFWYSDNIYADQLEQAGIKHGLFCNVFVNHVTSCTLKTLPSHQQRRLSYGQIMKYKYLQKTMQRVNSAKQTNEKIDNAKGQGADKADTKDL